MKIAMTSLVNHCMAYMPIAIIIRLYGMEHDIVYVV